jgi:hypothetical protein
MNIVEVGYNVQSAVDDKHNLIVDYEVTNEKDNKALAPMAIKSKQALELRDEDTITVLADKGYYKGEQIQQCHDHNIDTLVAIKDFTDRTKPAHVRKDKFTYDSQTDTYTCPNGQTLTKEKRYKRRKNGKVISAFDRYTIRYSQCQQCPFFTECVSAGKRKQSQGRNIDRATTQEALDRNNEQVKARKKEYKRRQAIVEHPFGTIKRAWGYSYTLMKTIPKVQTEFSIILLCYNLRRAMSILGQDELKKAFQRAILTIFPLRAPMKHLVIINFYQPPHAA